MKILREPEESLWRLQHGCDGQGGTGCGAFLEVRPADVRCVDGWGGGHLYVFDCPICGEATTVPSPALTPQVRCTALKRRSAALLGVA